MNATVKSSPYQARQIEAHLLKLSSYYPVVTLTGPRQSGKTTLVRHCFPQHPYISLEDPDSFRYANDDPRGFLSQYPDGAIFDEVQRVPELLSYLQTLVDADQRCGRFILTGSHNLLLMQHVSQSLAGRTGLLTLLPFSLAELSSTQRAASTNILLQQGGMPRIHVERIPPQIALKDYYQTFVERDVRSLLRVHDLQLFDTFVRLCAGRVGQLLNISNLANDVGISPTTAREWLGQLEAAYIIHRLPAFHANISKRLIKAPKLYFIDVGLACYLCGIEDHEQLSTHPLRGNFFENFIVTEALKKRLNQGKESRLHFYRDQSGNEIDILYPDGHEYIPIEVKSGKTINNSFFKGIHYWNKTVSDKKDAILVYDGDHSQQRSGFQVLPHREFTDALP